MNLKCFLSYAWESDAHRAWVRQLATDLRAGGVETLLDQWDLRPGGDFLKFMETAVRDANFVLLICTPTFAAKADQGSGGVGYEKAIVSGEIFMNSDTEKFIPILRVGDASTALPSYLKSRVYVDFTDDNRYQAALEDLLRVLHRKPLFSPPPVGAVPDLEIESRSDRSSSSMDEFKRIFEFAYGSSGLNLPSRNEAHKWTQDWLQRHKAADFPMFQEIFTFAYGAIGLNLTSRKEAAEWVENWLKEFPGTRFKEFQDAFLFACGSSGLDLSRKAASEWALERLRGG